MLDCIIDISHQNGKNLDFKTSGALGIIHKATQGVGFVDPMYASNRQSILSAGLRMGSYHFGTSDNGQLQAEHYLNTVGPQVGELLCLDFESSGAAMSIQDARVFVGHIKDKTGKWPVLYSGNWVKQLLRKPDYLLAQCPLWLAQYGPKAVLPEGWSTWSIWQFTDGMIGPDAQETPGIGHCDRDRFFGNSKDDLDIFWNSVSLQSPVP